VSWRRVLHDRLDRTPRRSLTPRSSERRAAVLVPILDEPAGPRLLIERRPRHLSSHAGQYAFPGGAVELGDGSVEATALRETYEEVGIEPQSVQLLGQLSDQRTPTGFLISPLVGAVASGVTVRPSPDEVELTIRVPLEFLQRPGAFKMVRRRAWGLLISSQALVWNGHEVWGATARMLLALRRLTR